ncbi:unnamed protein product [Cylindrotheca closterium]|uniref:EF-hand domain-containing protein n=1 Tax=Cylindrotheca closterium TaxID=2856 RepID=A0AAD2FID2_9STRA|nr:unnamed protein product [Cylindrotheca closterium]
MVGVAAASRNNRAPSSSKITQSQRSHPSHRSSPSHRNSSESAFAPSHGQLLNEVHDSEYDSIRPTLTRKNIERSFRILEDTRRQRKFEAKVMFKEYSLYNNKEQMKVDQLRPYMARVFGTDQSAFEEEAVKLVLEEAKKKSRDGEDDILTRSAVVSAVIKYGEYVRHYQTIHTLFQASDWSNDGKLQRQELRKLIQNYESSQTRNTETVKNVLLFVTEQDLNFILRMADENKDGDIDPTEVMRAIGVWEELAAVKLDDFDKMNYKCCHKNCTIS